MCSNCSGGDVREENSGGIATCDECFHPLRKHGPDGCTAERTVQIEGSSETQHGPCGCTAYENPGPEQKRYVSSFPSPLLTHPKRLDVDFEDL